MLTAQGHSRF